MSRTTPATVALGKLGIDFELRVYDHGAGGPKTGLQAANVLGEPPYLVLKTLMLQVEGRPVCVLVPSDCVVSMKKVAAVLGGKAAKMMAPPDVERETAYRVGAVSPFGQKHKITTIIEAEVLSASHVYVSGGQQGVEIRLSPNAVQRATGAAVARVGIRREAATVGKRKRWCRRK